MATKPKGQDPPPEADKDEDEGEDSKGPAKKGGLVGKILGPVMGILGYANPLALLKLPLKMQLIAAAGLVLVPGGGGAAVYFLMPAAEEHAEEAGAEAEEAKVETSQLPAPEAAFFDVPDIIVNIQTGGTAQSYLKLSVSLEMENAEAKLAVEPVLPRIIDQFQTYLRELRVEDIRGTAGVMRLKEELLRRVNLAAAPIAINDVLLKEMIVQ
jgi:flagellar protein FliL